MFDSTDFTMAYYNASLKIRTILEEYPSVSYILDLHRDSIAYGEETVRPVTVIDGQSFAQIMFVVGTDHGGSGHTEWDDNLNLAIRLQSRIYEKQPGLMRAINLRSASFNQQYTKGSLLIEMGAVGSSMEEAVNSAKILGDYLADEIIGSDDKTRELQAVRSGISGINSNISETSACLPQQDWGA
jgi:stage II sporulation protein P